MESLAQLSTNLPIIVAPRSPADILNRRRPSLPVLADPSRRRGGSRRFGSLVISALPRRGRGGGEAPQRIANNVLEKLKMQGFASISSSSTSGMSATSGSQPFPMPPPSSNIGSPLFWVGVGVGLSALFSMVVSKLKAHAMQQVFKTMMSQSTSQNGQFSNTAFSPGSPFSFSAAPPSSKTASSPLSVAPRPTVASKPMVTVDVPASEVEATSPAEIRDEAAKAEPKKFSFVDVSPEEVSTRDSQYSDGQPKANSPESNYSEKEVSGNGAPFKQESVFNEQSQSRRPQSAMSVEALEKMMEDPTVQKMVYPYLPEEMRNPTSFKWMLQNPQYRQQLEDMLNNMGGGNDWDSRMVDSLKNFDLSSPEVQQQFDQIGLTPEQVISKIMANPEVALAFQNPKVQAAIMDCSQNPLSIAKYQNDKEVMDVFNKISELFPGISP